MLTGRLRTIVYIWLKECGSNAAVVGLSPSSVSPRARSIGSEYTMETARVQPLLERRRQRSRDIWHEILAAESKKKRWTVRQIRDAVDEDVEAVLDARVIERESTANELKHQGRLAAHPDVRREFRRLLRLRDEAWSSDPELFEATLKRRSHSLVRVMKLQKDPKRRRHTISAQAYIRYVKDVYRAGAAHQEEGKNAAKRASLSAQPAPEMSRSQRHSAPEGKPPR